MSNNPAVIVAKNHSEQSEDGTILLACGVRARLTPVSTALMDEVTSHIKDPQIPLWHNPDKDRDEQNPTDPAYLEAVAETNRKRGMAVMDAMIMFGVELPDGLPSDEKWLTKLNMMSRRGLVDLSSYDLNDPLDKEFVFKRFIAVDNSILSKIGEMSAITPAEVEQAEKSFRGDKER